MSRNKFNQRFTKSEPRVSTQQKPLTPTQSIVDRSVQRSGLSYDSFVRLIIQSALSRLSIWSQADLDRLLLLAERLGLDPLSNEIYATELSSEPGKKPRIFFVVGVDGWSKIVNAHPQFDGMRFVESAPGGDELPQYFECTIFRKDRKVATSVREYMHEAHTNQGAWLTHPRRMLRHKAMVQCARICFGLSGIYEPDEAQRIDKQVATEGRKQIHPHKSASANFDQNDRTPFDKKISKNSGIGFVKNWVKAQDIQKVDRGAVVE
jgi:phage recombination protein Bet